MPANSILLVTDDELTAAAVGGALRATGFEVVQAANGISALETCLTLRPSLAVIDGSRSVSDGVQVAQQLTERFRVPFVYLSADEAAVSAVVAAGAMAYLVKPIAPHQLVPVVRAALRRSQELRALQSQTERLTAAVQSGKQIGIATGLIMANLKLDQQEAFERLRRQARARRVRLEDFAVELLRLADQTAGLYRPLESPEAPRRRTGEEAGMAIKERVNGRSVNKCVTGEAPTGSMKFAPAE
ncbi:MAG: ANTAR domain-containing protein [Steroidobacteraceae bacterium]